ncbi:ABC transporter ATP-binding protein [Vibrio sp. SS-MA-C1-2]|uniref:ABC transporter ATP-binding protein n=1 Tax=Vibrio sp. SS-MA-C1-2 TaxID=2908646 RepID=UPI001F3D5AD6|nr:ABC transporter ATP-binding protein [Vibrio sp. SS-MA-C1-2]UJF17162.1 ABC transporter ATP-binding protein [Vibrio sp. SS-MA-C1-2]
MENKPIVEGVNICKDFQVNSNSIQKSMMRALNDVSFQLYQGRGLAVVGESGSGKSTIAKIIAKMYQTTSGEVRFNGINIEEIKGRKRLLTYRQSVQMVWQDPFGSLNPTHTIYHHIARPLLIHNKLFDQGESLSRSETKKRLENKVHQLLEQVGLIPAKETARKFPHQLSGGQRQRVNLARNIAVGAKVVLADEPTSMLDVSIRAGVLNLMEEMKTKQNMALLYITHDIATARYIAEDLAVMYVGHMVEWGEIETIIHQPHHPYTQLLISAVPDPDKSIHTPLKGNQGEIPLWTPESIGCPFSQRCLQATEICSVVLPNVTKLADNHFVRCHLYV